MIMAFDLGADTFSEIPVLDFYTTIPSALLECIKSFNGNALCDVKG